MKSIAILLISFYLCIALMATMACTKQPYIADYGNIKGYVISKESCQSNEVNDYWLLDFIIDPDAPKIGETITFNGTTYTNVLKVKGLAPRLKQIGIRISIDYNKTSADKYDH